MKKQSGTGKQKSKTIFFRVFTYLMQFILLELLLFIVFVHFGNFDGHIRENVEYMLVQQVENRKDTLISNTTYWRDMTKITTELDQIASQMLEAGELDLTDPEEQGGVEFLTRVTPELAEELYDKRASGIFVVLIPEELFSYENLPRSTRLLGLCIRDKEPETPYLNSSDLEIVRAPLTLMNSMGVEKGSGWLPSYFFGEDECATFISPGLKGLNEEKEGKSINDYGYWTLPYTLYGSNVSCIAYVVPLMREDGTAYGFIGIELEEEYLLSMLPGGELTNENSEGDYILGLRKGSMVVTPLLATDEVLGQQTFLRLEEEEEGKTVFRVGETTYVAAVESMDFYTPDSVYAEDEWVLIGAVEESVLYEFPNNMLVIFFLIFLLMLLVGLVGSYLVGKNMTKPISHLAQEVSAAERERLRTIPNFSPTGIREIDAVSDAIVTLSQNVLESTRRFLDIIDMASVKLGGFEIRRGEDEVFITDSFFELFGLEEIPRENVTTGQLYDLLSKLECMEMNHESEENSKLYAVPDREGNCRYVRIQIASNDDRTVGMAEDVTSAILERTRIEHERDYDLLTGLRNRRSATELLEELFSKPEKLGCAAMVLLDLDELKPVNDRFGHDSGDEYIRQTGRCLRNCVPHSALCARLSGDEFLLFYHGYPDRESVWEQIRKLQKAITETEILMPDGTNITLRASCGVAWYPDNASSFDVLVRYADFAMYQVKRSAKGGLAEFDRLAYEHDSFSAQREAEFRQVLEKSLIHYHLQPIVNAGTGKVFAYESLMRVDMPTLKNPEQVISIARKYQRLADLERMTWFNATENYEQLREKNLIDPDALLFVNSFASQHMSEEDTNLYHQRFAHLQDHMVVEIVEVDHLDEEAMRVKRETPGFTGMFALDDYGSGYNSEKNLLKLSPRFIKVDISIIRNIDTDPDKQQIVSNIVDYAHARDMSIVAEGVETAAELETVIGLEVDLVQGFFLARPAAIPAEISPEAIECIKRCAKPSDAD